MLDGSWCRKCKDVGEKMVQDGVEKWVGHVAVADVGDAKSEGVKLASRFEVATAPFFLVRTREEQDHADNWKPVRSYLQLKKLLQDAAAIKASKSSTNPIVNEDKKILEHKRHADELRTQIELLKSRLEEVENKIVEIASLQPS